MIKLPNDVMCKAFTEAIQGKITMSDPDVTQYPLLLASGPSVQKANRTNGSADGSTVPTTIPANTTSDPLVLSPRVHRRSAFSQNTSAILHFHHTGTVVTLRLPRSIVLGRGTAQDVDEKLDLTDFNAYQLGVSRAHCQLSRSRYNLTVTDLGSANGTFLNGERLMPRTSYNVQHGDMLRLGSFEMTVLFSTSGTA